jgi:hypothetical protein
VPRSALPNILLAVADDLPRTALGAYGSLLGVTPALDALAASGRRLDEAHTPSPLCTPSRVSLLTGRYASCAFFGRERNAVRQMRLDGKMGESLEVQPLSFNLVLAPGLGSGERRAGNASQRAVGASATPALRAAPKNNGDESLPGASDGAEGRPSREALYTTDSLGERPGGVGGAGSEQAGGMGGTATADGAAGAGEAADSAPASGGWVGATTLGHVLRLRGYSTGFVGKWHMGHPRSSLSAAERRRVQRTPAAEWKAVRDIVLPEYRRVQGMVREAGFDYAERIYVNNLYPEQVRRCSRGTNVRWGLLQTSTTNKYQR